MKIAIIGTGISGLTAAYLLNKNHEITVFEKNDYVGGHTHTHELEYNDKSWAVDSGFIVYNEQTYPNFINLLNQIGVKRQITRMGFSVTSSKHNLEYAGHSVNGLFAQRSNLFNPSFYQMLSGMLRFNNEARNNLKSLSPKKTLGEYLIDNRYPDEFIDYYIIPIGSAIWSTVPKDMMDIPAIFFIRFFENHGLLQILNRPKWWVIKGGSKTYVEKMIINFKQNIRLSTPVKKIMRNKNNVAIYFGGNGQEIELFDAVILATHSNQALALLGNPTKAEKEILGSIPYQKNEALLHYDHSILPQRKLAWSSWNYFLDQNDRKPVVLTYNMNILQNLLCKRIFCVTLNSEGLINPDKVIKRLAYEHPLFTLDGINAQQRKDEISGLNNTYYCGSYWHNGFHEDGVVSALEVCSHFVETL